MTLEPNDRKTLIDHRLNRAQDTLAEAQLLVDNGMLSAAVNRIYYCMFYSLSALAIRDGYQTGKHAQLIGWFNKTYIRTGLIEPRFAKMIHHAFDKRMIGDYSDIPEFTLQEVKLQLQDGTEFIAMIEGLVK